MKIALQILAYIALACSVIPSAMFLSGKMEMDAVRSTMLIAMIVWFIAAAFISFVDKKDKEKNKESA